MTTMSRSRVLFVVVSGLLVGAFVLRVRSHLHRPEVTLKHPANATWDLPAVSPPSDYVAHPRVLPAEQNAGPDRIVSLAPNITEILCALGLRDRLVGRTPYCLHPPEIGSVPVVGALIDANFEKIKALSPDIVFVTSNSSRSIAGLQQLGLRHEIVPHDTLDEVYEAIERVGRICDRPETARELTAAIQADVARLTISPDRAAAHPRRVLIVLGPLPVPPSAVFVAGPGSFLAGLLTMAGHTNAAADSVSASHGEISLERLRLLDPEIIVEFRTTVTEQLLTNLYQSWAQVGDLQAIREQRVRCVGGEEHLSAGPRIALTLFHLRTALGSVD